MLTKGSYKDIVTVHTGVFLSLIEQMVSGWARTRLMLLAPQLVLVEMT